MKLTHWQYLQSHSKGLAVPCNASHQNFGGVCLNCGHDPNRVYKITFVVEE
jgi:hypothetical protein